MSRGVMGEQELKMEVEAADTRGAWEWDTEGGRSG
jgi:hypothetical protein